MAIPKKTIHNSRKATSTNAQAQRKKTKPKKSGFAQSLTAFVRALGTDEEHRVGRNEQLRTIIGLVLLAIALFMGISLIVYVKDAKAIYSQIHSTLLTEGELSNSSVGYGGERFGSILFNGFLGWGSFICSVMIAYIGVAILWMNRQQIYVVLVRTIQMLIASIWISLFLAWIQSIITDGDSVLKWGGDIGYNYSKAIGTYFGSVGLAIVLTVSLLIMLVLLSDRILLAVRQPRHVAIKQSTFGKLKSLFTRKSQLEELEEEEEPEPEEQGSGQEEADTPTPREEDNNEVIDTPQITQPIPTALADKQPEPIQPETDLPLSTDLSRDDDNGELIVTIPQDQLLNEEELREPYVPGMLLKHYRKPDISLLEDYGSIREIDREEIEQTKQLILETLGHFRIPVRPASATIGPTVTLYEIIPEQGVKISRIKGVENDLMLALKSQGIRIIAPMPGKGTVGIEVPNRKPQTVSMKSIMASQQFKVAQEKMELPIGIGKTITNEPFIFDLSKMPHLLIAGATGQGKSVGLNALITSLLYSKRPEELKLIMVDPKMLEFSVYEDLEKHFMALAPDADKAIITDMAKVVPTLQSLCIEMDNRYETLAKAKVRNIKDYNEQVRSGRLSRLEGFDFLPYIVLIVDEWADLIMTSGREAEQPIARLAQKARAAGIHLVLATQRPSTDVVTGLIKANFPARIAFKVSSGIDSSTILGNPSAHNLIGRGDMLFFQGNELIRIQCAFMDTPETEAIVGHICQQESEGHAYELPEYIPETDGKGMQDFSSMKKDSLFEEVARLVVSNQMGSASLIQRKMEIGFARAGRLMDQLEAAGIVGPQRGSKPREVLIQDSMSLEELLGQLK